MSRPADMQSETKPHGTYAGYRRGCRCFPCRLAGARYDAGRTAERRAGLGPRIVDSDRARRHILRLSAESGIGYKSVARGARVAKSVVLAIRGGRHPRIFASTERKILAVGSSAAQGGTVIPIEPTLKKIEWLLSEGFTKRALAHRLGYKGGVLHFNYRGIQARNCPPGRQSVSRKLRVGAW